MALPAFGKRPSRAKRCTVFNLPSFPTVFTTRHITCVSCKEKFAVTEGGDGAWFVRANVPQTVNLQYESERQQRPVVPNSRQIQQPVNGRLALPRPYELINCPRCGADNRNWLALTVAGNAPLGRIWRQRFPGAFAAIIVAFVFAILALTMPAAIEISWWQAIILALSIIVVSFLFINNITSNWEAFRDDVHVAKILPKTRRLEPTLWGKSILFLVIASLVLPVIIFAAGPIVVQEIFQVLDTMPKEEVEVEATEVNTAFDTRVNQSVEEIKAFGDDVQDALEGLPTDDQERIEKEIEELSQDIADTAVTAAEDISLFGVQSVERLEENLDTQITAVENARKSAVARFRDEVMGGIRFLAIWCLLMGLTLVITMMIMMPAMKAFALRADANLPPPVFYSVANMTRLVTWEARQALEVQGIYFPNIQWMSVDRNDQGGLDLVGLFRERPDIDIFGQPIGTMVRAQKHTIHTDKWCRVTSAKIEDVIVPIPVKGQGEEARAPRADSPQAAPVAPNPVEPATAQIEIGPQSPY